MSLSDELRDLEREGIDLIDVLGHDRHLDSPEALRDVVLRLGKRDESLHAELLFHLTQRRFPWTEAEEIWTGIMRHKALLEKDLGRPVTFRVAALEHLESILGILSGVRLMARPEFESLLSYVNVDEVSGVQSRRCFNERLVEEVSRARRYANPLALLLLDLDGFKRVNDTCGHLAGDAVLRKIGALLKDTTRQTDTVSRFGGDEFALLLPETDRASALVTAERIREAVTSIDLPGTDAASFAGHAAATAASRGRDEDAGDGHRGLTISIGGACYPAHCEEAEELVALADQMCLAAKRAGKDCVRICEPDPRVDLELDP